MFWRNKMGEKRNKSRLNEDEKNERMNIAEKIKANYFTYSGRLNRKKFAMRTLNSTVILALVSLAWINLIDLLGLFITTNNTTLYFAPAVVGGIWLASNISLGIRRAHDLNRSTKWYLWLVAFVITVLMHVTSYTTISLIIDIVIALFFIYCYFFFKGTVGDNEYGKDMVGVNVDDCKEVQVIVGLLAIALLFIGIRMVIGLPF